jgi:hypothetical protein
MAFAVVVGKVMFVEVMIETAYGDSVRVDYPNLAGKAEYSTQYPVSQSLSP